MTAQRFRMSYVRPLGQHVPVDEELLAALERDAAQHKSEAMHRRIIWACVVFLCAWAYALLVVTP